MRRLLAAVLLLVPGSLVRAGELIELTDGTKLTVESHWNDGDEVHLLRGGVDMIVAKSRIKSIDPDVKDPEVYVERAAPDDGPANVDATEQPATDAVEPPARAAQAVDPTLASMSATELQALHQQESRNLRQLTERSFNAAYGGTANAQQKMEAADAVTKQNQRTTQVWTALQEAKKAESGGEQPQ